MKLILIKQIETYFLVFTSRAKNSGTCFSDANSDAPAPRGILKCKAVFRTIWPASLFILDTRLDRQDDWKEWSIRVLVKIKWIRGTDEHEDECGHPVSAEQWSIII